MVLMITQNFNVIFCFVHITGGLASLENFIVDKFPLPAYTRIYNFTGFSNKRR